MTDASTFLMGGGARSVNFDTVGDTVTGKVVSSEVTQQTDIQTGQPAVWENGEPKMQLVVKLETDLRDPADDTDDGLRSIYVKGSRKPGSKSMHDAVASACRAAKAKGLEVGGTLTVSFIGEEPPKTRGFSARKLYGATYVAPDKAAESGGFLGTLGATPVAAAAPVAAAVAPAVDDCPEGVDPALWAQLKATQAAAGK